MSTSVGAHYTRVANHPGLTQIIETARGLRSIRT
jgi:hypothetical protein